MINVTSQISGSVSDHRSRADISCRPCAFDHLWWRGLQQPHQACDSGLLSPWVQTQGPYFVIHEKRNLQRGGWSRRASPAKFEAVPREWQVALWSSSTSPCSQECICPVACWRKGPIFWQIFRWSNGRLGVQFARSCLFPKRCYLAPARPGGGSGMWHNQGLLWSLKMKSLFFSRWNIMGIHSYPGPYRASLRRWATAWTACWCARCSCFLKV